MFSKKRFLYAATLVMVIVLVGATAALAHGGDLNLIHACVKNDNGGLRIVGANDSCKNNETALDWGIVGPAGPQGPAGAQGPIGETGPAGPSSVATGVVGADGQLAYFSGPRPTIANIGPGQYSFTISGVACPLLQVTANGSPQTFYTTDQSCGIDSSLEVRSTDGINGVWSYMFVVIPLP